jgi:hypothetical protein
VARPVTVTGDALEVRLLTSGAAHLVFVLNHAATPAAATVAVRVPLGGRAVRDLANGKAVPVTGTASGFEWRERLGPRDVRVLVVGAPAS